MNTPVLFAPGFRGKVAAALLSVVSCVKRVHVGTADMGTFEDFDGFDEHPDFIGYGEG